tara:strand:+ start:589 stop:909 length:321 start_codon:yes stop_codon:yes gene_type:complete
MNKITVWNNEECKVTEGKSGASFNDILTYAKAGDYLLDADGKTFMCSHAELELNTKFNWYICFNPITTNKQIDRKKQAIVYERNRQHNTWTKYMKSFEGEVPLYEQ